MSGPFPRIRQALARLFGQTPQPVYREKIGKPPAMQPTGPINVPLPPEQQHKTLYRVGLNYKTGLGQYPTKAGVAGALSHVKGRRVQVRVYGMPAWDTTKHTSPPPDALGNVTVTYFAPRLELEAALAQPGDIQDWVFQSGSYNFQRVLSVSVGEA